MRVRFTHRAEIDITELYHHGVKNFGITQADRYAEALHEACAAIADFPGADRLRMEYMPPVRIRHYASHYIIYVVDSETILVIRVLHHASDITRHLHTQPVE